MALALLGICRISIASCWHRLGLPARAIICGYAQHVYSLSGILMLGCIGRPAWPVYVAIQSGSYNQARGWVVLYIYIYIYILYIYSYDNIIYYWLRSRKLAPLLQGVWGQFALTF